MKKILSAILCVISLFGYVPSGNSQTNYSAKVSHIRELLADTDLEKTFNGSLLIADGSVVLLHESYGTDQAGQPNSNGTAYEIASMGKMFTSVAIMQLIETEKLSLEQTIGELLPDHPNEQAKAISIRQLLSHTSGLGDFFGPEFDKNKESVRTLEDYLPFFVNDPLESEPGEMMRYSNAGYIVLGLIIEKVSKTTFNSYFTENILQPAGMTSTGPLTSTAGGGKSTIRDLHRFALALQANQLITGTSFTLMRTDHFGNGYGYGMSLRNLNGKKVYGHNGGAPGVSGELDMVEKEPLIIVSLSNRSPMNGWAQVRTRVRKEFFGSTPETEEFLNTELVVKTYQKEGFEKASKLLETLNNTISDKNTFRFAEQYAMAGQPEKAIDILKLIVQAYADQWYPYSFLADFQLQAGQKEEAIRNYRKSLELNPENEQAIRQLKAIGL